MTRPTVRVTLADLDDAVAVALRAEVVDDLGAVRLPPAVAADLGLRVLGRRRYGGEDVDYVGVRVTVDGRVGFTGAIVVGDRAVVGGLCLAELGVRLADGRLVPRPIRV